MFDLVRFPGDRPSTRRELSARTVLWAVVSMLGGAAAMYYVSTDTDTGNVALQTLVGAVFGFAAGSSTTLVAEWNCRAMEPPK